MRWLDGIIDPMDMNLSKLLEIVRDKKQKTSWVVSPFLTHRNYEIIKILSH